MWIAFYILSITIFIKMKILNGMHFHKDGIKLVYKKNRDPNMTEKMLTQHLNTTLGNVRH